MASRRILKRDINYVVSDLILDCYACMEEQPEKDFSRYEQIINDAIIMKEDLYERINHFDPSKHGSSKDYFLTIRKDLFVWMTQAYENLKALGS
ncbi:MAG: hypothetical protein M0P69_10835 [Bacteroidales bacterium]|jgi:hypothetical protein|nr:hypothetical protein [Bacteroidales bacterium]MDD2570796.1 hypothetical protein [Bacteroidales bacterium]MDD2812295.1 hypothetical protein [Bacteroidales bacterium]MDD3385101.1 hypothetical protein [Bacteroidales bacterium]MDD3871560.1 hypothetical protein [Bacteroidales bacterium]